MSAAVAVVTDSTADLPAERIAALGIHVVPLEVRFGQASFLDGLDLPPQAFYDELVTSKDLPTTSQPSPGRFREIYEGIEAESIVSIHLSSKLSGTASSASLAAAQVPHKRIAVIDSGTVSLAMGYLAQAAAEAARDGALFDEVRDLVNAYASQTWFYAALETLHFAHRSGRITFAQTLLGSVLQVKPILTIREGQVQPVDRPRTMGKALNRLVDLTLGQGPFRYLAIPHANNLELARRLAARLTEQTSCDVDVVMTGATIGTHCGPGAVATCGIRRA